MGLSLRRTTAAMHYLPARMWGVRVSVLVRQRHSDASTMALTVTCGKRRIPRL